MEKSSFIIKNVLCHHQYVNLSSIFHEIFITAGFYNKKQKQETFNSLKNYKHDTSASLFINVGKKEVLFMLKGVYILF